MVSISLHCDHQKDCGLLKIQTWNVQVRLKEGVGVEGGYWLAVIMGIRI